MVTPANWVAFAAVTLVTAFAYGAIGALIGVVATDSRSTVLYSQLIFLPSMILGGMMMPAELLPATVRPITALLPATYTMQAYLGLAFGILARVHPVCTEGGAVFLDRTLSESLLALQDGSF